MGILKTEGQSLFTAKEAATLLGISISQLYGLAAPKGPVPCYRIGRSVRFSKDDLETYLAACRQEPRPPIDRSGIAGPAIRLRVSSVSGESDLERYFRKMGITPKRKL